MKAHHLKNILNLFKKNMNTFNIYCKSNQELIIHLLNDSTQELLYHFELISDNNLTIDNSYVLCVNDLYKLFKYVKSNAIIKLNENSSNLIIEINLGLISQILLFPLIIIPPVETISGASVASKFISYDNMIDSAGNKVSIILSDFSRIIKSLKNTSDNYSINYTDGRFIIRN